MEVDDDALRKMGTDAANVLAPLDRHGYRAHKLKAGNVSAPMNASTEGLQRFSSAIRP